MLFLLMWGQHTCFKGDDNVLRIDSNRYKIDVEYYENNIHLDSFKVWVDVSQYGCALQLIEAKLEWLQEDMSSVFKVYGKRWANLSTPEISKDALRLLLDTTKLPLSANCYVLTKKKELSVDISKVVMPCLAHCKKELKKNYEYYSDTIELLEGYIEYSHYKSMRDNMRKKIYLFQKTDLMSPNNLPISTVSSYYERQSTGRYYTKNDAIQTWCKESLPSLTVPKGYFLAWSDFDQIDLRVAANLVLLQNAKESDIEVFKTTDDKYEAMARIMYTSLGMPFSVDGFKQIRKSFKVSVLARMYGAKYETMMQSGDVDGSVIKALNSYYNSHQYYQQYLKAFNDAIGYNCEVMVYDYFGFKRTIYANQIKPLDACLNSPIQSTSNDVVILWVNELVKAFRDLGFGEDKFSVYLIRHDEALFLVHEDCKPYLWLFKKMSEIRIDDWTPLTNKPSFGYNYTIEDKDLMKNYETSIANNFDKTVEDSGYTFTGRKYLSCKATANVFSFYPDTPVTFAIQLFAMSPQYIGMSNAIKSVFNENDKTTYKEAYSLAKQCMDEFKTSFNPNDNVQVFMRNTIDRYNRYYNLNLINNKMDNTWQVVKSSELIKFIEDNGIGYVTFINPFVSKLPLIKNDVQYKYDKDSYPHDSIVNLLEKYCYG